MNRDFLEKLAKVSLSINALQPEQNIYDAVCTIAIKIFGLKMDLLRKVRCALDGAGVVS